MSKKWLLALPLAASLSLAACGGGSAEDGGTPNAQQEAPASAGPSAEQPEMPEADLAGIPDVVAEVNGDAIPKAEFVSIYEGQFQQLALQSQMSGQELDQDQLKDQTIENMIGTELLIQEAANRDLAASDEDVSAALDELVKANQLKSADEFIAAMEEQGMNEEEVNSQLKTQVVVDQLIADEAGDTKVSEEELKAAYEELKAQQEQMGAAGGESAEVPSLEEVKPNLEAQLVSQKEAQAAQALVGELRADADVKIHL